MSCKLEELRKKLYANAKDGMYHGLPVEIADMRLTAAVTSMQVVKIQSSKVVQKKMDAITAKVKANEEAKLARILGEAETPKASNNNIKPEFDKLPSFKPGQRTMRYAGIGSRETPTPMLEAMTKTSKRLAELGYTLQTGVTFKGKEEGADKAFSDGTQNKELFAPESIKEGSREWKIAGELHPNWGALVAKGPGGPKLMARNTNQVFGKNLDTPVDFVLFYAKEQEGIRPKGGTGQAVEMARLKGIPTINMATEGWEQQLESVLNNKPAVQLTEKFIEGDLFKHRGPDKVIVVTTNLGGKHGAGTAAQAQKAGLISEKKNREFKESPIEKNVLTVAVKGREPSSVKDGVTTKGDPLTIAWAEQVTGANVELLKEQMRLVYKYATTNPHVTVSIPFVGLGHGEGNINDIAPVLGKLLDLPNVQLVVPSKEVLARNKKATIRSDDTSAEHVDWISEIKKHMSVDTTTSKAAPAAVGTIYNKLGSKTVRNNVVIKSVYQQAGVQEAKDTGSVFSLRVNKSNTHFGNPFSSVQKEIDKGLVATGSTKESVEKFIEWVLADQTEIEPARHKWIRDTLKSGKLKGKPVIYYKELGEPSHATALDYLINEYNWVGSTTKVSENGMLKTVGKFVQFNGPKASQEKVMKTLDELVEFAEEYNSVMDTLGNVTTVDTSTTMKMFRTLKAANIPFKPITVQLAVARYGKKNKDVRGWAVEDSKIVMYFGGTHTKANPAQVLLHEYVHTITQVGLQKNKELQAKVDKLMKHVRTNMTEEEQAMYGMTNAKEFLAEAIAEPKFQEILSKIPPTESKGVLAAIKEMFKELLDSLTNSQLKEVNALTEALELVIETAEVQAGKSAKAESMVQETDPTLDPEYGMKEDFEEVDVPSIEEQQADINQLEKTWNELRGWEPRKELLLRTQGPMNPSGVFRPGALWVIAVALWNNAPAPDDGGIPFYRDAVPTKGEVKLSNDIIQTIENMEEC